jgi:diguanylate cyclase
MPDGFFIGVILSAVLLALGVLLGLLFSRSQTKVSEAEVAAVLAKLLRFTNNFSRDFSEYRSLIEAASQQATEMNASPTAPTTVQSEHSAQLFKQIMAANELLQKRLLDAESTLQAQSVELNTYMTEARTDVLTGLMNRRAFDEELNRRFAIFRRQGIPAGVMLLDVDRFKAVNDTYGHAVGDAVLVGIADALKRAVRETDMLARYGGEEFAVVITGLSPVEFAQAAERLRRAVESSEVRTEGHVLRPTVSCGVTQLMLGDDMDAVFHRADKSLYAAKKDGRNCTFWNDGSQPIRISSDASLTSIGAHGLSNSEQFRDICAKLRNKLQELSK